ncbi:putative histone deacetylase complex protein, partial [Golovinomyces cichoracearum]
MNSQTHGSQGFELNLERESSSQQHCQRNMIKRENNDTQHCQRIMVKRDKEEISQREREHSDIQDRERQHREQYQKSAPHQGNTSTIPIHQPVASRVPGAIHNPGGILANHSDIQSSGPMVVQSIPGNVYCGPSNNETNRPIQYNSQPSTNQQHQHQHQQQQHQH